MTNGDGANTISLPFKDFLSAWSVIGDKSESSVGRDQEQDELETSPDRERGFVHGKETSLSLPSVPAPPLLVDLIFCSFSVARTVGVEATKC